MPWTKSEFWLPLSSSRLSAPQEIARLLSLSRSVLGLNVVEQSLGELNVRNHPVGVIEVGGFGLPHRLVAQDDRIDGAVDRLQCFDRTLEQGEFLGGARRGGILAVVFEVPLKRHHDLLPGVGGPLHAQDVFVGGQRRVILHLQNVVEATRPSGFAGGKQRGVDVLGAFVKVGSKDLRVSGAGRANHRHYCGESKGNAYKVERCSE